MTLAELIKDLAAAGKENMNKQILGIGTLSGSDRECDYIIHLTDDTEIKVGRRASE